MSNSVNKIEGSMTEKHKRRPTRKLHRHFETTCLFLICILFAMKFTLLNAGFFRAFAVKYGVFDGA